MAFKQTFMKLELHLVSLSQRRNRQEWKRETRRMCRQKWQEAEMRGYENLENLSDRDNPQNCCEKVQQHSEFMQLN